MEEYSEYYKAKCIRRLKEWGAPLDGWYCVQMYDIAEEDESPDDVVLTTCELCDCSSVRYVHVMRNHDYFRMLKWDAFVPVLWRATFLRQNPVTMK